MTTATLSQTEFEQLSQQVSRLERYTRHEHLLNQARASGDTAAQLEHGLHVADVRMALAKSPADKSHWAGIHHQLSQLVEESGFEWKGGRLTDPATEQVRAKSLAKSLSSQAAQYQELRGEIMGAIARARSEGDRDSLMELYGIRDQLTSQARNVGLRLDSGMRFIPARG